MPRKKKSSKRRRPGLRLRIRWRKGRRLWLSLGAVGLTVAAMVFLYLWVSVGARFDSLLWQTPAQIYSDVMAIEPGTLLLPEELTGRLDRSGYARVEAEPQAGQYRVGRDSVAIGLRAFRTPALSLEKRGVELRFSRGRVSSVRDARGRRIDQATLEPELLATLYGARREERRLVTLDQVPQQLIDAILAAEDRRFYEHHGIDPRGILRAAGANVKAGRIVQGGSTITQQTVKNLYLGQQRTWWRKIRETLMSVILDARYSKERILEAYLNEVYLGQRGPVAICGFQAAARFYFGRDLADLQTGEYAVLAGLIRSPGSYNPFRHPERSLERRDQLLAAMRELGTLDDEALQRATAERLQLASGSRGYSSARYAVDYIRSELAADHPSELLATDGLKVYTTVDTRIQSLAEQALQHGLERLERRSTVRDQLEQRRLQGAVLVLRPRDGAILALVGGRDHSTTQFNRAVQARRQPGSCFKPFVYAAGFELALGREDGGLLPSTRLADRPLRIETNNKVWQPANYDRRHRGNVTARQALEESLNVPTVRAAQQVGIDRVIHMARRCGIESPMSEIPSLALGTEEVTPLELAEAYGTLAAGGLRHESWVVASIDDGSESPFHRGEVAAAAVVPRFAAIMIDDVLRGVFERGTAKSARSLGYRGIAAGKTGTTDDTRDAWFVGYTDEYLALVWVGYDDNGKTGLTGATGALPIWTELMQRLDPEGIPGRRKKERGTVRVKIDPESGLRATRNCPQVVEQSFLRGTEPRQRCDLHEGRFRSWFRRTFGKDKADDAI